MDESKSVKITKIFLVDCDVDSDGYATIDAQVELEDGRIVMIENVSEIAVGMGVRIKENVKRFHGSTQVAVWEIVND